MNTTALAASSTDRNARVSSRNVANPMQREHEREVAVHRAVEVDQGRAIAANAGHVRVAEQGALQPGDGGLAGRTLLSADGRTVTIAVPPRR